MVPVPKLPVLRLPGTASTPAPAPASGIVVGATAMCPSFVAAGVCHKSGPVHQEPAPIPGLTPVAPQREPLGASDNTCWHHQAHSHSHCHPHSHSRSLHHPFRPSHPHPHSNQLPHPCPQCNQHLPRHSQQQEQQQPFACCCPPAHQEEAAGAPCGLGPDLMLPSGASRAQGIGVGTGATALSGRDHVVCIRVDQSGACQPHTGGAPIPTCRSLGSRGSERERTRGLPLGALSAGSGAHQSQGKNGGGEAKGGKEGKRDQ